MIIAKMTTTLHLALQNFIHLPATRVNVKPALAPHPQAPTFPSCAFTAPSAWMMFPQGLSALNRQQHESKA